MALNHRDLHDSFEKRVVAKYIWSPSLAWCLAYSSHLIKWFVLKMKTCEQTRYLACMALLSLSGKDQPGRCVWGWGSVITKLFTENVIETYHLQVILAQVAFCIKAHYALLCILDTSNSKLFSSLHSSLLAFQNPHPSPVVTCMYFYYACWRDKV